MAKTTVVNGIGKALVIAVGLTTASGSAAEKTAAESEKTMLQLKLNKIADSIGKVGYGCAICTFIAICIRLICEFGGLLPCGCTNLFTCEQPDIDPQGNM